MRARTWVAAGFGASVLGGFFGGLVQPRRRTWVDRLGPVLPIVVAEGRQVIPAGRNSHVGKDEQAVGVAHDA
jgi:hypothetical protein